MSFKFILFEGVDGSGKSTLAKGLAEKINGVYYHSPPKILEPLRVFANKSVPEVRLHYFLLGNVIASEEIKELLKASHVVCDKYIFSTLAFHQVLLGRKLPWQNVLMPDIIVYTTADIEEVDRRLNSRDSRTIYEERDFLEKVAKEYDEILSNFKNVVRIDTTGRDPAELVEEMIKFL